MIILRALVAILLAVCCSGQGKRVDLTRVENSNWKKVLNALPPQPRIGNEDFFDRIIRINANARSTGRTDGVFLYQGDIVIPDNVAQRILSNQQTVSRGKRAVIKNRGSNLWRRNIAYAFASNLNAAARNSITRAVRRYEQVLPCLGRWTDVTNQRRPRNYMYFFPGGGCYSQVGFKGGAQRVSIGRGCEHYGVVVHEIGHALGLWHEQSRPDRDGYVRIYTQNIISGMAYNFQKQSTSSVDSLGVSYDYGSIMHYGPRAFSRNGQPTIRKLDGSTYFGQRRGLSNKDIQQLQKLYRCNTVITTTKPTVCTDNARHRTWCRESKGLGLCQNSLFKSYMASNCCQTCKPVPRPNCQDKNKNCDYWKNGGYCTGRFATYMKNNCPKSCRRC